MNLRRQSTGIALFVLSLVMVSSGCTKSPIHEKRVSQQEQTSQPTSQSANAAPDKGAVAHNLARERYQLAEQIERQLGSFPLWSTLDEGGCRLLFPKGRADKVYVLSDDGSDFSPKYKGVMLFCYQRKNNDANLVYRLNLKDKPSKHKTKIKSLMTYLNACELGSDELSPWVRHDLTKKQDYVQYSYSVGSEAMFVVLFSQLENNHLPDESKMAIYRMDEDPITHARLRAEFSEVRDFCGSFGLPGAKGE